MRHFFIRLFMLFFIAAAILFFLPPLQAEENKIILPRAEAVPGGIAFVNLGESESRPRAFFKNSRLFVFQRDGQWEAMVGIPLLAKPGKAVIKVRTAGSGKKSMSFIIEEKIYDEQQISLATNRHLRLSRADLRRYKAERARSWKALRRFSMAEPLKKGLIWPVNGRISSSFGLRRFYNNRPRQSHNGIDVAAPTGTAVVSCADGVVIDSGNFFFNGKTLFIDHGQGLVTMYCHLSEFDVKTGETVTQGQLIGKVGQTGRSTGPHLHWSIALNGALVNPLLFVEAMPD
ncbi:MAG TPA: peptidoglycan DD-metalloendopeptidase family protein [Smithellaceae bacterium]|nr:peptidoglycan DD-metalloendopeptidase family protein [Smithellaceae bacterium]